MFVLNRINEISENSDSQSWKNILIYLNPVDLGSRGCNAKQLRESLLWFSGPPFLRHPESERPIQPKGEPIPLPDFKVECNLATEQFLM